MITANDLKNIDPYLGFVQVISNKKLLKELRQKIADELDKIKIKVKDDSR